MDGPNQIKAAVYSHPEGIAIRFEVVPGSKSAAVPSGFNPWRKSLEAKLTEKPTKGKANQQLIKELASLFNITSNRVEVMSGHKSSRKVVLVRGLNVEEAVEVLAGLQK